MKELIRLIALVEDIESTLFHYNHSIDGWHLSGETEPIMNFVADFDMEALTEAKQTLQALTSVKSESAEEVNILDKNLLFKFKDEHNTAEITLSMRDIWANVQEYVYDKLESGLPSCNCTNESNPFCECPPIYGAFELSSISMHNFANAEKKQHAIGFLELVPTGYYWSKDEIDSFYNEYLNTLNNKEK